MSSSSHAAEVVGISTSNNTGHCNTHVNRSEAGSDRPDEKVLGEKGMEHSITLHTCS